jgi:phospholipase/carboxylesterase
VKQGKSVPASLEHLVFYPESTERIYPTIVALHGRGTDEYDLLPIVETLPTGNMLLVAPRAPFRLEVGGLGQGFAWYEFGQEGMPSPQTFMQSVACLSQFMKEIKEAYPVDVERIVLLGFSQGTVMAYATALQNPRSVRAIIALSGYIPHQSGLPLVLSNLKGLSVFISHGTEDDLIPVRLGRESAAILREGGATVMYHEYVMGHEVREETLRDLGNWLRNIFP